MASIRITIITVVYNGAATLEDTIKSVASVATPDTDFIIIDGGSTDGTLDIIKKYDSHISYWISEPDKGIYDAMNKGWAQAAPDSYILFLGSGDKILKLPDMHNYSGEDAIYGRVYIRDNQFFKSTADFRLKLGNTLHHQALLIRKCLHPDPPFSLEYKVYGDFDFNQRLLKKGVQFIFSPDFIAYALPGGISQKIPYRESIKIVKRNFGIGFVLISMGYYALMYIKWNIFKRSSIN